MMSRQIDNQIGRLNLHTYRHHEADLRLPFDIDSLNSIFQILIERNLKWGDNAGLIFRDEVCNNMLVRREDGSISRQVCPLLAQGYCRGMDNKGNAKFEFFNSFPALKRGTQLWLLDEESAVNKVIDRIHEGDPATVAARCEEFNIPILSARGIKPGQIDSLTSQAPNCQLVIPFREVLATAHRFSEENAANRDLFRRG